MARGNQLKSLFLLLRWPIIAYLAVNGLQVLNDVSYMAPQRTLQLSNARLTYPAWLTRDDAGQVSTVRLELLSPLPIPTPNAVVIPPSITTASPLQTATLAPVSTAIATTAFLSSAPILTQTYLLTATDGLLFVDKDNNAMSSVMTMTLTKMDTIKSVRVKHSGAVSGLTDLLRGTFIYGPLFQEIWYGTFKPSMILVAGESTRESHSAPVRFERVPQQLERKFRALIFSQGGAIIAALGLLVQQLIKEREEAEKIDKLRRSIDNAANLPLPELQEYVEQWATHVESLSVQEKDSIYTAKLVGCIVEQFRRELFVAAGLRTIASGIYRLAKRQDIASLNELVLVIRLLQGEDVSSWTDTVFENAFLSGFWLNAVWNIGKPQRVQNNLTNNDAVDLVRGIMSCSLQTLDIQNTLFTRLLMANNPKEDLTELLNERLGQNTAHIVRILEQQVEQLDQWTEEQYKQLLELRTNWAQTERKAKFRLQGVRGRLIWPNQAYEIATQFVQGNNSEDLQIFCESLRTQSALQIVSSTPDYLKPTLRLNLEYECRQTSVTFAVNYRLPIALLQSSTAEDHARGIAGCFGNELFAHFCETYEPNKTSDITKESLPEHLKEILARYLAAYGYHMPTSSETLCQPAPPDSNNIDINSYAHSPFFDNYRLMHKRIERIRKANLDLKSSKSPAGIAADIGYALRALGFSRMLVLIDDLDQIIDHQLVSVETCVNLLQSLIEMSTCLEQQSTYIRVFLPPAICQELLKRCDLSIENAQTVKVVMEHGNSIRSGELARWGI